MLTLRETSYALFGAWRLAHFDRQGVAYFDRTREGALRSFWAAAILLPAYVILVLLHLSEMPVAIGFPSLVLLYAFQYVVAWTALPAAMAFIARTLDREEGERWGPFGTASRGPATRSVSGCTGWPAAVWTVAVGRRS